MAENDQRAYRDPLRRRSAQEAPRAQADDPLAELARLIGQSVPMNKLGQDRRAAAPESADDRRGEADHAASYPAPDEVLPAPTEDRYSAPEVEQYERDVGPDHRERGDERYEPITSRQSRTAAARLPFSAGARFRRGAGARCCR